MSGKHIQAAKRVLKHAGIGLGALAVLLSPTAQSLAEEPATRGLVFDAPQPPPVVGRSPEPEFRPYEASHAVIIGVDNYDDLPALKGAERDARAVADRLRRHGFQVTELLGRAATRKNISELLGDQLPNRLGPHDRVLIYFAGHGVSTGQEGREMGYLMPVEGERASMRATGISMRELQNWFADYRSKHVMFVADACYSGLAISTRSVGLDPSVQGYLQQVTGRDVRMSMTAGSAGEVAHEWRGHGLFTYWFLEALDGAADANRDGILTSDEIAAFVKPNVTQTAWSQFSASQTPQVGRSGEGEFIFLVDAGAPRSERRPEAPAPRAQAATPEPAKGYLHIDSDPQGALVEIDGRLQGLTPWGANLPAGRYGLTLHKDAYRPLQQEIEVRAGERREERLSLSKEKGYGWGWLATGLALIGAGVALDVLPASAANGRFDLLDTAPAGLYLLGGIAVIISF